MTKPIVFKVTNKQINEITKGLLILEDSLVILRDELLEKQDEGDFDFEDGLELKSTRENIDTIYDIYKALHDIQLTTIKEAL